jgi:hypothetical protein
MINSSLCVKTGAAIGAELAFPSGGRWHGVSRDGWGVISVLATPHPPLSRSPFSRRRRLSKLFLSTHKLEFIPSSAVWVEVMNSHRPHARLARPGSGLNSNLYGHWLYGLRWWVVPKLWASFSFLKLLFKFWMNFENYLVLPKYMCYHIVTQGNLLSLFGKCFCVYSLFACSLFGNNIDTAVNLVLLPKNGVHSPFSAANLLFSLLRRWFSICDECKMQFCPAGCPSSKSVEYSCPVCGSEYPERVYTSVDGEIIGCGDCVTARDADSYFTEKL